MIEVRETGTVYRNPRPELRSRHTWHPTVVRFDDGEMLVTFDIAEADVSLDYRTYATHSTDGGGTWSAPTRVFADPPGRPTTHSVRSARVADGSVVAMGALMYRDDPEKSVVNVPTLGYTEMELIITRSQDRGHTWGPIERVAPPLEGPAFEVCHSIVELRDGRWVWPCSTWMGWDGDAPERDERDPPRVGGPGPDLAVVHHRVRPLGRGHHPLGAALPRAAGRPLADGRLGRSTSARARRWPRRTPSVRIRARLGTVG